MSNIRQHLAAVLLPALFTLAIGSPVELRGQGRPLTLDQLTQIYGSGGDTYGWDEFDIPEFVAAAYGPRAKQAVIAILTEPSRVENYYLQLEALTTAQYPKVGVPQSLIMGYADGQRTSRLPSTLSGLLRYRALSSLSMIPDQSLVGFWQDRLKDGDPNVRQMAVRGLACALGEGATTPLSNASTDPDSSVKRVAAFYREEFRTRGANARSCGGRSTRIEALEFPQEVRPGLRHMGDYILRRIP